MYLAYPWRLLQIQIPWFHCSLKVVVHLRPKFLVVAMIAYAAFRMNCLRMILPWCKKTPEGKASKLSGWIRGSVVLTRPTECDTGTRAWGVMRGSSWFWGGRDWNSVFNTALKPNDTTLDCGAHGRGYFAARSNHTGGANCAMVDGSVRFVTNQIDSVMWQAAATRAGGEVGTLP